MPARAKDFTKSTRSCVVLHERPKSPGHNKKTNSGTGPLCQVGRSGHPREGSLEGFIRSQNSPRAPIGRVRVARTNFLYHNDYFGQN